MASSIEIYDEMIAYTALKMEQYRALTSEIEELEKEEEDMISGAYGAPDGDIGAVMDQINVYRDQVLCLRIEIEQIWSDMHAHRASLMTRYRDQLVSEL